MMRADALAFVLLLASSIARHGDDGANSSATGRREILLLSGSIDVVYAMKTDTAHGARKAGLLNSVVGGPSGLLIHVKGPVLPTTITDLQVALGGELGPYIPHDTFYAVATPAAARRVSALPFVIWIGMCPPRAKLHPSLHDLSHIHPLSASQPNVTSIPALHFHVLLGPLRVSDGQLAAWGKALRRISASADLRRLSPAKLALSANSDSMAAAHVPSLLQFVGALPHVLWVQRAPSFRLKNAYAKWILQSGRRPTAEAAVGRAFDPRGGGSGTPIFDHGLRGQGQLVGAGDTGIDIGMCFFRDMHHEVPVWPKVDMDHRKIVSYRKYEGPQHPLCSYGLYSYGAYSYGLQVRGPTGPPI